MNEFDIIAQFFAKQIVTRPDVILGIGDDCAIVEVPADQQLAITTDTLVAGVHFPTDTPAFDIGYKSLAVNLSDLAAMGATPAWITLALTLPEKNVRWLTEFSRGLFELAQRYQIQLIGGDITRGPLTITIEAKGFIPKNQALKRSAAKVGDLIYVTNTLGDAALGLLCAEKKISLQPDYQTYLLSRLNRPEPRVEIGEQLRGIAHAAIDISDGLAADLGHILEKSQVGATVYVDALPLSEALLRSVATPQAIELALNGGDDYELCFTAPKEIHDSRFTCIGIITQTLRLNLLYKDERPYSGKVNGYQHF